MRKPTQKDKDAQLQRRWHIWQLRRGGQTMRKIAAQLDIPLSTVNVDIQTVMSELRRDVADLASEALMLDLERIDDMLCVVIPKVENGELAAIDRMIKLLSFRADILGTRAVKRVDLTSGGEKLKGYINISPDDWDEDEP